MPNWTQNEVQIFGNKDKLKLFKESVASKESKFDFELIVPKPKVLGLIPANGESGLSSKSSDNFPNKCWYEWCIHNWGTKWNACRVELSEFPEYLEYKFETAWDSPRPVFATLWFLWHLDMKIIWKCRHEDDGFNEEEELDVKIIDPIIHSSEANRQAFLKTLKSRFKGGKK